MRLSKRRINKDDGETTEDSASRRFYGIPVWRFLLGLTMFLVGYFAKAIGTVSVLEAVYC